MNKCVIVVLSALLTMPFTTLLAQPTVNQGMDEGGVEDMFVHPFLAHMGLPEMPNEVSLRITGYRTRFMGGKHRGGSCSSHRSFAFEKCRFTYSSGWYST